MKVLFILSLFVVCLALSQVVKAQADEVVKAQADEVVKAQAGEAQAADRKSVAFGQVEAAGGRPRVYDPCNSNPNDHNGCAWACWGVGYYKGGFCSGSTCYCYI